MINGIGTADKTFVIVSFIKLIKILGLNYTIVAPTVCVKEKKIFFQQKTKIILAEKICILIILFSF